MERIIQSIFLAHMMSLWRIAVSIEYMRV